MPIYQRTCEKCGFSDENIEKISEGDIHKDCPECGEVETYIKGVSVGTGFRLKGEGWYKDGYNYQYTECMAGQHEKKGKGQVAMNYNLEKKLKARGIMSDE